jgi:phosphatidate cytidylyltransferase
MKRLLTAVIGVPLALWAAFRMPPLAFFILVATLFGLAAWEYGRIAAHWAPEAPLWIVVPLVPMVGWALAPEFAPWRSAEAPAMLALLLSVGVGTVVLFARTPMAQGLPAMAAIAFGGLYLGLPVAALAEVQRLSPWLLFLLWAIVWVGDSAAFYVGTAFGRRRLASVVSPKKSWEGALAALVASALVAGIYSLWREGALDVPLIGLALATSVAAQVGDLVESVIKRGAGVKDSGMLLPGHGGFLDRFDALTFAAPVWWFALELTGRLP